MILDHNGVGTTEEKHYLITAQVGTPQGPQVVNLITPIHPARLILKANQSRELFTVMFFAELPGDVAKEVNDGLKELNGSRSPILVPR